MKINDDSLILITNRNDIECFVKEIAKKRYNKFPASFAGEELCINYKLRYELPCHSFKGLKNYILRVKDATGLRSDFRGVIAIHIDEWLNHEDEEYFEIFLKYLSDHQEHKQYIFVIKGESMKEYQSIIYKIMKYIQVGVEEDCICKDKKELLRLMSISMKKKNINIEKKVIQWLIDTVYSKHDIDLFNETLRESILSEMMLFTKDNKFDSDCLYEYLKKEKTILGLFGIKEELDIERKQL